MQETFLNLNGTLRKHGEGEVLRDFYDCGMGVGAPQDLSRMRITHRALVYKYVAECGNQIRMIGAIDSEETWSFVLQLAVKTFFAQPPPQETGSERQPQFRLDTTRGLFRPLLFDFDNSEQ